MKIEYQIGDMKNLLQKMNLAFEDKLSFFQIEKKF